MLNSRGDKSRRRRRAIEAAYDGEKLSSAVLLSIIWESNVSPPRHPREAFWSSGDAREKEGLGRKGWNKARGRIGGARKETN